MATKKKVGLQIFFHPSLLLLFLDPGWTKIRIRDEHLESATLVVSEKPVFHKIRNFLLCNYEKYFWFVLHILSQDQKFFNVRQCSRQCCGSGSAGSVCFLGLLDPDPKPLVRGTESGFGSFYNQAKIVRKTLIPRYCFVTSLWLFIFKRRCKCCFKK